MIINEMKHRLLSTERSRSMERASPDFSGRKGGEAIDIVSKAQ